MREKYPDTLSCHTGNTAAGANINLGTRVSMGSVLLVEEELVAFSAGVWSTLDQAAGV